MTRLPKWRWRGRYYPFVYILSMSRDEGVRKAQRLRGESLLKAAICRTIDLVDVYQAELLHASSCTRPASSFLAVACALTAPTPDGGLIQSASRPCPPRRSKSRTSLSVVCAKSSYQRPTK